MSSGLFIRKPFDAATVEEACKLVQVERPDLWERIVELVRNHQQYGRLGSELTAVLRGAKFCKTPSECGGMAKQMREHIRHLYNIKEKEKKQFDAAIVNLACETIQLKRPDLWQLWVELERNDEPISQISNDVTEFITENGYCMNYSECVVLLHQMRVRLRVLNGLWVFP
jgi:hypothetical protein